MSAGRYLVVITIKYRGMRTITPSYGTAGTKNSIEKAYKGWTSSKFYKNNSDSFHQKKKHLTDQGTVTLEIPKTNSKVQGRLSSHIWEKSKKSLISLLMYGSTNIWTKTKNGLLRLYQSCDTDSYIICPPRIWK